MDVFSADWLAICRRIAAAQRRSSSDRRARGAHRLRRGRRGGDRTLAIDRQAEDVVFAELERLAEQGASFLAVSEERGEVEFGGGGGPRVVIDPIDGSLNARRTIPSRSLASPSPPAPRWPTSSSASSTTSAPTRSSSRGAARARSWTARRSRVAPAAERLEVVGIESAEPEWSLPALETLAGQVFRLRVVGAIAISAAYVGAGRFDAMLSLRSCRSVDAAAAQLIVREAGGFVAFGEGELAETMLDLESRYPMAAASSESGLATVRSAQLATVA